MGPPIFIGGNLVQQAILSRDKTGFNGATDFHRWKYISSVVGPFMGTRFNGATDFHRWKCKNERAAEEAQRASMGPPIFIGGNFCLRSWTPNGFESFNGATDFHRWKYSRAERPSLPVAGFNGATDFHRWKLGGGGGASAFIDLLQWGHRFSSVEMRNAKQRAMRRKRFNGATDFHRWKSTQIAKPPPSNGRFNGATDFHRWKLWGPNKPRRVLSELQWGHRFSSVEIWCGTRKIRVNIPLQWGHRFSSVEMRI